MQPQCCWHKDQISPHECPSYQAGDEALLFDRKQRFLTRCINCSLFIEDLRRFGPGAGDLPLLLPFAVEEIIRLRSTTHEQQLRLENLERQGGLLREVNLELQTTQDKDAVIAMALTAITAGEGFALNRAFLLLVDRRTQMLNGYLAVGPRDHDEAGRIWQDIERQRFSLREMAQRFHAEKLSAERAKFGDLLKLLSVPLDRSDHLFIRTLDSHASRHVPDLSLEPDIDPEQARALGAAEILLVPLISKRRRIGLLLADNLINRRPLGQRDLQSLETFAAPVAHAIERAELHERLQQELEKITAANRRLREQQLQILQMEKMALVGRVTADIAHSIRNPLTIIGGYARNLLKNATADDALRPTVDAIIREARRLETALDEVLLYSEARHPTLDDWDVNQIVQGVNAGIQESLDRTQGSVRLELDPSLPLVKVDFKGLSHCLRTLLQQVLDAAKTDSRIEIFSRMAGGEILLGINGSQLDPGRLAEIGRGAAPDGKRNPLGLDLITRILEEQNARLQIVNDPDSSVEVTIALTPNKEQIHEPVADC